MTVQSWIAVFLISDFSTMSVTMTMIAFTSVGAVIVIVTSHCSKHPANIVKNRSIAVFSKNPHKKQFASKKNLPLLAYFTIFKININN